MCEMCNPRQGEGQRVLEEDDLDRIALIAHYIGGVSKDTGKRHNKSDPKTYPKTDRVGHEHTRYDPTLQVERRN